MSTLLKKKLIFDRTNVDLKIIIKTIKVRIIKNNQMKFVNNKKEKSIKKKRLVKRDVVDLDKK